MFIVRTIKADEKPSLFSRHDLNNQGFDGKIYKAKGFSKGILFI